MKHSSFLIIVFMFLSVLMQGKDTLLAKNTVYVEILGNAAGISVNYDRLIFRKKIFSFSISIGAGMIPANEIRNIIYDEPDRLPYLIYGMPVSFNGLYGKKNNYIEFGFGATYQQGMYGIKYYGEPWQYSKTLFTVIRLGYRFQRSTGGFFWKIGFTPFFPIKEYGTISIKENTTVKNPFVVVPLGGISLGYTFKK